MKLFEDKIRTNHEIRGDFENLYFWYNDSAWTETEKKRNILNNWFEKYPNDFKKSLISKFKNDFISATYELFIHEFFLQLGCKVVVEPVIANSLLTPDFLVQSRNSEFYVEVTSSDGKSHKEKARENFEQKLISEISKIHIPNFYLGLKELKIFTDKTPKTNRIKNFLKLQIAKFDANILNSKLENGGKLPTIIYTDDTIQLSIILLPKSKQNQGKISKSPFGMYMNKVSVTTFSNRSALYRKLILSKLKKYRSLEKSLMICVNYTHYINDLDEDVDYALFGENIFSIPEELKKDFGIGNVPIYQKLGAVLFTKLNSSLFLKPKYRLIVNSSAEKVLNLTEFDIYHELSPYPLKVIDGKSLNDYFTYLK